MGKESQTVSLTEAMNARDRRGKIVLALYRCMAKKGYAATTLCDVAEEAGMSSSHLLYYYSGKEAILEAFFKAVTRRVAAELVEVRANDPRARLIAIADLLMSPTAMRKADQGVMLDLYAQAVQNKAMRKLKVESDRNVKAVFVELFRGLPGTGTLSPEDAGALAFAQMVGLRASSFYDTQLTSLQANRLFKQALLQLGGLPAHTEEPAREVG
jgi:AcrR family transcriptional regulator